jgi:DNA-binding beta-propeller fold protein YncE
VQRIDSGGVVRAEWRMPKSDRGKPVGATVAPDGTLVVADTHEHRLVAFTPDGRELWTLGSYGTDTGQFIYPTDVVYLPDGRLLVAEYGGHDRIQAFSADRRFMYAFGTGGTADGEFLRPQALAYDAARDELYVADAGNHRIQVFTSDGEFRRSLGTPGAGVGQLRYPFGLVLLVDGRALEPLRDGVAASIATVDGHRTLVVVEHSNHRVQELDARTGNSLGIAGGLGRELGRLKYPWAIASAGLGRDGDQRFAVCEQGNSRIAFFTLPRWSRDTPATDSASRAIDDGGPQDD